MSQGQDQPGPAEPGPAWDEPGRGAPLRRWEVVCWGLLLAWLLVSRWTVAPDVLYEWDSANYALGLREFDIFQHQPHPPGYPIYTVILRGLALLSGSVTWPFLAANSLFGAGILLLLGWMVRRSAGPAVALGVAAAYSVCPQFWFQGAVTTAYVAECFCSVSAMALALALLRGRVSAPLAAALFALVLGVRPSGVLSFSPVLLLACLLRWPGGRRMAQAAAVFCAGCALWFIPLVALGGGWDRYWEATAALYQWQRASSSLAAIQWNVASLVRYLLDGLNLLWLVLTANMVLVTVTRAGRGRTAGLFAAWFLPAASIYSFHHLAKSAYVLTLVPIGYVAAGLALGAALPLLSRRWRRVALAGNGALLLLFLAFNVGAFYSAVPSMLYRYEDARIELPRRVLLVGDYGRYGLRYRTYNRQRVNEILARLDPEQDLALFTFGALELHRIAHYSRPQQWKVATSLSHGLALQSPAGRWEGPDFGRFQLEVLKPVRSRRRRAAVCLDAQQGRRLVLTRGARELAVPLHRAPRKLVVLFAGPRHRLHLGRGVVPLRRLHVGAGFHGWELRLAGTAAAATGHREPNLSWRPCARSRQRELEK